MTFLDRVAGLGGLLLGALAVHGDEVPRDFEDALEELERVGGDDDLHLAERVEALGERGVARVVLLAQPESMRARIESRISSAVFGSAAGGRRVLVVDVAEPELAQRVERLVVDRHVLDAVLAHLH